MQEAGQDDRLVLKMIESAAVAGGCRILARREPDAAKGLLRAAAFHSGRVQALAGKISETATAP